MSPLHPLVLLLGALLLPASKVDCESNWRVSVLLLDRHHHQDDDDGGKRDNLYDDDDDDLDVHGESRVRISVPTWNLLQHSAICNKTI